MTFPLRFLLIPAALLIVCVSSLATAAAGNPILVSEPNSTRAIALEATSLAREPFAVQSQSLVYGSDRTTRIMLFALNLALPEAGQASMITADAEDAGHVHHVLRVEYVAKVSELDWLTIVVLRLDETMTDLGDVLIQTTYRGVTSNRVRVGIGHVGGGPADDPGAGPTPAAPYALTGKVISAGAGLDGVMLSITGSANMNAISDANGAFSFILPSVGDYSITASRRFFTLSPATIVLPNLSNSQAITFLAARKTFLISGVVKDGQGNGVNNVSVRLETAASGSQAKTVTTSNGGLFTFQDVPAGYNYTITPLNTNLFTFIAQTVTELDENHDLNFNGTLRRYDISGLITDKYQKGVPGVSVSLSGEANDSTTTDANGNYSFKDLFAGRNYSVTASKTDHFVSPGAQTFNLLRDERADFSAIRYYTINGRVTDGGRGLYGIAVTLTGSESAATRTSSDGSYSLTVTTAGDYVLAPSREQNFYAFTPSQTNLNVTGHVTVSFTGSLAINGATYVLEFDGTQTDVDYKFFWPQDTNVGSFFWEFWAMPGNDAYARYLLSDGYGGAHALLFGFNYGPAGHYSLSGNIWNGAPNFYFYSDDGPSPGEWGHYAVGWDGQNVITYYDGVPVGKRAFSGPRSSTGWYNGSNMLLIGGSDHQNLIGRIAQVRGYEENNPRAESPESAFRPQTIFSVDGQLLSYYFTPAPLVADMSYGYNGIQHNGRPRGFFGSYSDECVGCSKPRFVIDLSAPNFTDQSIPAPRRLWSLCHPRHPAGHACSIRFRAIIRPIF